MSDIKFSNDDARILVIWRLKKVVCKMLNGHKINLRVQIEVYWFSKYIYIIMSSHNKQT